MLNDDFLHYHEVMDDAAKEAGREWWERFCAGDEKAAQQVALRMMAWNMRPFLEALSEAVTEPTP